MMLPLVDKAKRSSREKETEICIQRRKALVRIKLRSFLIYRLFR